MLEKVSKMAGTCMSMLFPRSVTFPSSRHLKTAESGTSMMSFLARNAEFTGNFGGSPQGTFFIHDGHLESTEICKTFNFNLFSCHSFFRFCITFNIINVQNTYCVIINMLSFNRKFGIFFDYSCSSPVLTYFSIFF